MSRSRRLARLRSAVALAFVLAGGGFVGLRINPEGALGTAVILALLAGEITALALAGREANRLAREQDRRDAGA